MVEDSLRRPCKLVEQFLAQECVTTELGRSSKIHLEGDFAPYHNALRLLRLFKLSPMDKDVPAEDFVSLCGVDETIAL